MAIVTLTSVGTGGTVLVNTDWIAYAVEVEGPKPHTKLTMGLGPKQDGATRALEVTEKLSRIRDLIRDAS
jgi:hypothetical protein